MKKITTWREDHPRRRLNQLRLRAKRHWRAKSNKELFRLAEEAGVPTGGVSRTKLTDFIVELIAVHWAESTLADSKWEEDASFDVTTIPAIEE